MIKILLSTIGLSATDCLDPLAISVEIYLLTTRNPVRNTIGFATGIAIATFLAGLFLAFGLIREIDIVIARSQRIYFSFQLMAGILLALAGAGYWRRSPEKEGFKNAGRFEMSPLVAFAIGIVFTATDLPTNVPLLAVTDALVKENAAPLVAIASCLVYSVVRLSTPLTLMAVYLINRDTGDSVIERIRRPLVRWGHRITAVIIVLLGCILGIDSAAFFTTGKALIMF